MERKIGEIFEYNGEWYQCVKDDYPFNCMECCFYNGGDKKCGKELIGYCSSEYRSDGKEIIFKKLEKVGEPITKRDRTFQCLKAFKTECAGCVFLDSKKSCDKNHYIDGPCYGCEIWAEIKQTKEDMEEKYSELTGIVHEYMDKDMTYKDFKEAINDWVDDYVANKESDKPTLKPFDLEAAKKGKPVCTRDGRKARIICFYVNITYKNVKYPIVAAIENEGGEEAICTYNEKGEVLTEHEYEEDLMMLPEKKEGWINVYKERIYSTKEEAVENKYDGCTYIDTIKVEWEE